MFLPGSAFSARIAAIGLSRMIVVSRQIGFSSVFDDHESPPYLV
jgi:hypothetical protein